VNRKLRTVLGTIATLALLSTIGLLVLPRIFSPDSGEITLEECAVNAEGNGTLRYQAILPAGSTLMAGWSHSPTDDNIAEEVSVRAFPGWALKERRTLTLGRIDDLYTRMKQSPDVWRRALAHSLLLAPGKAHPLRKGERLALFQVPRLTVYVELR